MRARAVDQDDSDFAIESSPQWRRTRSICCDTTDGPAADGILGGLFAALLIVTSCSWGDANALSRQPFPDFEMATFAGDTLRLSDLEGKVVLVTIWTSWCPACRIELPVLDSLHGALRHPDFAVIGINEDLNEGAGRGLARALGLQLPVLAGGGRMRERLSYTGVPYTALLDREGRVLLDFYGWPGYESFDRRVVGRALAELRTGTR